MGTEGAAMNAPRTIMLPNGTFVDMTGVVSASIVAQPSPEEPCVVVTTRDAAGEVQVERNFCETDEQAAEARDVILLAVKAYFPAVTITGGGDPAEETGEEGDHG